MADHNVYQDEQFRRVILSALFFVTAAVCLGGRSSNQDSEILSTSQAPASAQTTLQKEDMSADERARYCKEDKDRIKNGLREIFLSYQGNESTQSIKTLVEIDRRIRVLLEGRPRYRPCKDDSTIYQEQWAEMGVLLGYGGDIDYSGRLLDQAHRRDAHSTLRSHTLFSTILGITPYHGLGVMPNIRAAFRYVKEFPDGPFAKETYLIIANFHKDLFLVLRDSLRDYKYECFKQYIGGTPVQSQKQRAKRVALQYYRRFLEIDPSNENAVSFLKEVEDETVRRWSFCAD